MKVLIVVPQFPLDLNEIKGGVHSALINLIKGFAKTGVYIRVLSINNNIKAAIEKKISDKITIVYEPEGIFSFHLINYLFFGSALLKKHCMYFLPDLIHFQEGNSFLMLKRGIKTAVPIVLTIHGNAINDSFFKKKIIDKIKWRINGYLERVLHPYCIIYLSPISAYNSKFKKIAKSQIIPNAVDEQFFSINLKKINNNKLIFIGVLNNRRNLLLLLKTLNSLIYKRFNYTLDVIGGFENDQYKKIIINYVQKNKLQNSVTFHGWVGQNVILNYLNNSDILVMTSMVETLPMVIAEAMAAGKVVVSSDVGGVPNMITHKKNGFIFSLNHPNYLYEILKTLYDNHYLMQSISMEARKFAHDSYHHHSVAQKTLLFYKSCLVN